MSTNSTTFASSADGNYATHYMVSTGKELLSCSDAEAASFFDVFDFIEDFIDVGALTNLLGAVPS